MEEFFTNMENNLDPNAFSKHFNLTTLIARASCYKG